MRGNAHFNRSSIFSETRALAPYRPDSVIPVSDHSPRQEAIDNDMITALAVGRLIQHFPHAGETKVADRYWAPSRTSLETTPVKDGPDTYEIVGGWVTREQAMLELAEPVLATGLEARRAA